MTFIWLFYNHRQWNRGSDQGVPGTCLEVEYAERDEGQQTGDDQLGEVVVPEYVVQVHSQAGELHILDRNVEVFETNPNSLLGGLHVDDGGAVDEESVIGVRIVAERENFLQCDKEPQIYELINLHRIRQFGI